jgi:hypothetical protein
MGRTDSRSRQLLGFDIRGAHIQLPATRELLQNVSLCHMVLLVCRDGHVTIYHLTAWYMKDKELKV